MKFVKFVESRHLPLSLLVVEIFCKKRTICLYGIMIDYNCERKKKKSIYLVPDNLENTWDKTDKYFPIQGILSYSLILFPVWV